MESQRTYFLTTERLGFGVWSAADMPLAIALWGDPRVTALIGGPFTQDMIQDRLDREIFSFSSYSVQYWPIFLRANGSYAGCAGLRPHRLDERIYELGFHLRPECWGRGLAEEAARAVIDYAWETLHAGALFAGHHPENAASQRLLSRLGFRSTHEELYPPTGLNHPSYLLLSRPVVSLIQSPQ